MWRFVYQKLILWRTGLGVVNATVIVAAACGICPKVSFDTEWAKKLLNRWNWVKRRKTTAKRHLPEDITAAQSTLLEAVSKPANQFNVPPELIVNFDETGLNFCPSSEVLSFD